MTWARFEDRFPWHRKVRGLSDSAFRLHVSAVCWSNEHLTDGHLPGDDLPLLSDVRKPEPAAAELVRKTLWLAIETGWQINDFLVYNESRATILARREADAERKRRGREGRTPKGVQPDSAPDTSADSPPESVRPDPARPEPTQEPPATQEVAASRPKRATRVPDTFPPNTEAATQLREWAADACPLVELRSETENWQDWHRAKGDTAKDWTASWRTWMRRAQKDAERNGGGTVRSLRSVGRIADGDAILAEAFQRGQAQPELGA